MMRRLLRIVMIVIAVGLLSTALADAADPPAPVAIVSAVTGSAWVTVPGELEISLRRFQWLYPDNQVRTGSNASVVVVTRNGSRYEVGADAAGVITTDDLRITKGRVRRLSNVPPLPAIGSLPKSSGVSAVRVRGPNVLRLYPADATAVFADDVRLEVSGATTGARLRVQVIDERGQTVFDQQVSGDRPVTLAPGTLQPGRRYEWRVNVERPTGFVNTTSAVFVTLPRDLAARRRAFADALDATDRALLAVVDLQLGLVREARDELQAAVAAGDASAETAEALRLVQEQLPSRE